MMKNPTLIIAIALVASTTIMAQNKKEIEMKVAVWDTYVTKKNGKVMHFDIIAPQEVKDTSIIYGYGKSYLKTKGQAGQSITAKECRFCHIETLKPQWKEEITQKGYFIIEMENCQ